MSEGESFFSRWSQRKQQARESKPAPAQEQTPQDKTQTAAVATPAPQELQETRPAQVSLPAQTANSETQEPPPTLADVQALTPNSDFSRFVGAQVDPEVRHAAMRKLFSDPHFNVMDGLDVYIEDYNKTTPLPLSKLKQLASAKVLGLVQESVTSKPKTGSEQKTETSAEITETPPHADPDLRLQQDDAAGPESTGDGARGDADTA